MSNEVENEIQARIEFKFNEFLDGVKNRLAYKYGQAFDMTQKSQYIWQAFDEISQIIKKEVSMGTPYDDMAKRRQWEAKEKAVEKIVNSLNIRHTHGRDYPEKIKVIVSAIEMAQRW